MYLQSQVYTETSIIRLNETSNDHESEDNSSKQSNNKLKAAATAVLFQSKKRN